MNSFSYCIQIILLFILLLFMSNFVEDKENIHISVAMPNKKQKKKNLSKYSTQPETLR